MKQPRYIRHLGALFQRAYLDRKRRLVGTLALALIPVAIGVAMAMIKLAVPTPTTRPAKTFNIDRYQKCPFGFYGDFPSGTTPGSGPTVTIPIDIPGIGIVKFSEEQFACQMFGEIPEIASLPIYPLISAADIAPFTPKRKYDGMTLLSLARQIRHTPSHAQPVIRKFLFVSDGGDCEPVREHFEKVLKRIKPEGVRSGQACHNGMLPPDCVSNTPPKPTFSYTEKAAVDDPRIKNDDDLLGAVICKEVDAKRGKFDITIRMDPLRAEAPPTKGSPVRYDNYFLPYVGVDKPASKINYTFKVTTHFYDVQNQINFWINSVTGTSTPAPPTATISPQQSYILDTYTAVTDGINLLDPYSVAQAFPKVATAVCHMCSPSTTSKPTTLCSATRSAIGLFGGTATAEWDAALSNVENKGLYDDILCTNFYRFWAKHSKLNASMSLPVAVSFFNAFKSWIHSTWGSVVSPYTPVTFWESSVPTPSSWLDTFGLLFAKGNGWAFVWLALLLPFLYMVISSLITDKTTRVRHFMKIMGVRERTLWSFTYLYFVIWGLFFSLIFAGLTFYVTKRSSFFFHFILFFLCCINLISWAVLITSLASKPRSATLAGLGLVFAMQGLINILDLLEPINLHLKRLMLIMFPLCFSYGINLFLAMELSGHGNNVGLGISRFTSTYAGLSFGTIFGFLLMDAVLMFFIGWYLYQAFPDDADSGKPAYFLFTKAYWVKALGLQKEKKEEKEAIANSAKVDNGLFQDPPRNRGAPVLQTVGLRKTYTSGTIFKERVSAVKDVSFEVYEDEIFALLGHNGAGKTTTINMLIGVLGQSGGSAKVMGYDIEHETAEAQDCIGYCPQHDILFDYMTVREHLKMYSIIRGVPKSEITAKIDEACKLLEIEEKIDVVSRNLSGGQKRRLSVAIALVGGVKAILMDEPSSGMDPYTRRALWETLKEIRKGRGIILTTHAMEEAEYLGDRIGIMAAGTMQCIGTSHFLKHKFGVGYSLVITKTAHCDFSHDNRTKEFVLSTLPGSQLVGNVSLEISFKIPYSCGPEIPGFLDRLEAGKDGFGMDSYTMASTTLEEVFLKVGHHAESDLSDVTAQDELRRMRRPSKGSTVSDASMRPTSQEREIKEPESYGVERVERQDEQARSIERIHTPEYLPQDSLDVEDPQLELVSVRTDVDHKAEPPSGLEVLSKGDVGSVDVFKSLQGLARPRTCWNGWRLQVPALMKKRFHNQRRDGWGVCCQCVLPLWMVLLNLITTAITVGMSNPPMSLDFQPLMDYPYGNYLPQPLPFGGKSPSFMDACPSTVNPFFVSSGDRSSTENFLLNSADTAEFPTYQGLHFSTANAVNVDFTLFHNSSYVPSIATTLNTVAECRLRENIPTGSLRVANHPLDRSSQFFRKFSDAQSIFNVAIGIGFIPAMWGAYAGREITSGAKFMQMMSGVTPARFWISSFISDVSFYIPPALIIWGLLEAFGSTAIAGAHKLGFLVGLAIFPFAIAPWAYLLALFAKAPVGVLMIIVFQALFLPILAGVLKLIPDTAIVWNNGLKYLFYMIPNSALAELLSAAPTNGAYGGFDKEYGVVVAFMLGFGIVCFTVLLIADTLSMSAFTRLHWQKLIRCGKPPDGTECPLPSGDGIPSQIEDDDVAAERTRMEGISGPDDIEHDQYVVLNDLKKWFPGSSAAPCSNKVPSKMAVDGVSFAVRGGECFGFLGVNGAGKTTTLKMLTTTIAPTSGAAYLDRQSIMSNPYKLWRTIGYCPQFDSHIDLLTGKEHLELYARLNLIDEKHVNSVVEEIVQLLGIKEYKNRLVGRYSGGNRRKLSVALAFMGDPKVVFLDEPSTGVDPASRRKLWSVITETTAQSGRAVILTTHSMEECEALCSRLAIMKAGRLVCIGTSSHLKGKFGKGYQIDVGFQTSALVRGRSGADSGEGSELLRIQSYADISTKFSAAVKAEFEGARQLEKVGNHEKWTVPKSGTTRAKLFRFIEDNKSQLSVESYAVSDVTLESIFVNFCRNDDDHE